MTAQAPAPVEAPADETKMRNVRAGRVWDEVKAQTQVDGLTITAVVLAALADYRAARRRGDWPAWLPR